MLYIITKYSTVTTFGVPETDMAVNNMQNVTRYVRYEYIRGVFRFQKCK